MTPPPTRRTATSNGKVATPGRASLSADLLADLNAPGALPTASAPAEVASSPETTRGTPALSVTVTPLRWRVPTLKPAERGTGISVRVGPLRVELAF